jgi:hypothetical protein
MAKLTSAIQAIADKVEIIRFPGHGEYGDVSWSGSLWRDGQAGQHRRLLRPLLDRDDSPRGRLAASPEETDNEDAAGKRASTSRPGVEIVAGSRVGLPRGRTFTGWSSSPCTDSKSAVKDPGLIRAAPAEGCEGEVDEEPEAGVKDEEERGGG